MVARVSKGKILGDGKAVASKLGAGTRIQLEKMSIAGIDWEIERPQTAKSDGSWEMSEQDEEEWCKNIDVATRYARELLMPSEIKAIRKKLGLSQREASRVLGGGERSFQKLEAGTARPGMAMASLLWLLNGHPELLHELRFRNWPRIEEATRA